jgi:hypothetical protein
MDVSLLDDVVNRRGLLPAERVAFFALLDAVSRTTGDELARLAQGNLPMIHKHWLDDRAASQDERRLLVQEVIERASEGRYSVAPLFLEAERHVGQLAVVDGRARRAVRVEVGTAADGNQGDIPRRFGLDHYYELEVFTDDSQNLPLVFCVRELPAAFPQGVSIDIPVRIAGFLFKGWRFQRGEADAATENGRPRQLVSPLLIGHSPAILEIAPPPGKPGSLVAGLLFAAILVGICCLGWWYARDDRLARARRRQAGLSLPPGESFDGLP